MAKTDKMITFPVRVTLPEADVAALMNANPGKQPEEIIQQTAQALVKQTADGGLMLLARDVDVIEQTTGAQIMRSDDLVRAVNTGTPMKDGQRKFTVTLDPAFADSLKETCDVTGLTMDEFVTQVWNLCVSQGYLFSVAVRGGTYFTSEADQAWMDEFMGCKGYALGDVIAKVKAELPQPVGA